MTLQTRLQICLNGLIVATVAVVSAATLWTTVHTLRERAKSDALGTASLLASAASVAATAPQEVDRLVGEQMVVEARLTAHLVALAEGRAHLSNDEINAILKDVKDRSAIDEFWIAGSDGIAHLSWPRPAPGEDEFRFEPDHPQSGPFYKLLEDKTGTAVVVQKAQRRALDKAVLKYVGVSGVDKPRIVQVGYNAQMLDSLASKFDVRRLVRNVIDAGNLEAIFVADPTGLLVASSAPRGGAGELPREYRQRLLRVAQATIHTLRPSVTLSGPSVEAAVPLPWPDGRAGAVICRVSAAELDAAIVSAVRDTIMLGVGAVLVGVFLSTVLAQRVSGPVRHLAEAARVIGAGEFKHRVPVDSSDEVGQLAESFNSMAASLETHMAELARTTAAKESLEREMDIAAEIQRTLLPESCPQLANLDLAAESRPAREVGGDFYDFIPLPGGRWGVVIADAAGKGVPAALMMSLSRSLIRAYSQEHPSILRAMQLANQFMVRDSRAGMFVTCFYAVLDPATRSLTYVNAGHNPAVVAPAEGQIRMLAASGPPLGVLEESGMSEESCPLTKGDVILMYTDGLTEAIDKDKKQFGVPRLESVVRNSRQFNATDILNRTFTAVDTFCAGQPQFDDMTAVVIKVL